MNTCLHARTRRATNRRLPFPLVRANLPQEPSQPVARHTPWTWALLKNGQNSSSKLMAHLVEDSDGDMIHSTYGFSNPCMPENAADRSDRNRISYFHYVGFERGRTRFWI